MNFFARRYEKKCHFMWEKFFTALLQLFVSDAFCLERRSWSYNLTSILTADSPNPRLIPLKKTNCLLPYALAPNRWACCAPPTSLGPNALIYIICQN